MRTRAPGQTDRGSALLLFPAGLLIVLVLAAIAFDLSWAFQHKRQLVELADAAANDAVSYGLDEARLRRDGSYCLAADRVERSVRATLNASGASVTLQSVQLLTSAGAACPSAVAITIAATTPQPFSAAVPGLGTAIDQHATGRATAVVR
ncbi:MAG: pilus assembly protein TadG-related protein [Acidimicrobiales bacterium]